MTEEELREQLTGTETSLRELQKELAETNRGVAALILELEQHLDERSAELRATRADLEQTSAKLGANEATVHTLQEELAETSRGLVALNLELEQRVDARTAELRQLNQELEARVQERTAQLRQANDNLQNFAHSAAHDLRSPLRAIANFSAMALEDHGAQLGSEGQFLLQRVTQSAAQMRRLLDDLLEYSKLSQAEMKLERVSLQDAVREALSLLDADIRAKNAAVQVEDSLPAVVGHPATVVLLVNNYVSNALKFIPPGVQPQVRIWAELVRGPESKSQAAAAEHAAVTSTLDPRPSTLSVRLWVEDNGIGIEQRDLAKVFGVFQRLHGKDAYPGTGLGLAIVRKGAERMGGAAGVESTPGQGSRFWFQLPQAAPGSGQ